MPRNYRLSEVRRAAQARRADGLGREVRRQTTQRESASGPTSPAVKIVPGRDQDLIAEFLKKKGDKP